LANDEKINPTYDIQVYEGHDELFRVQWTARDVSNVDCCVDKKIFGLLFYKPCQCHPYYLIFWGGSKDGDVVNGDFGVPSVFQ
jgi:hypothetical protein